VSHKIVVLKVPTFAIEMVCTICGAQSRVWLRAGSRRAARIEIDLSDGFGGWRIKGGEVCSECVETALSLMRKAKIQEEHGVFAALDQGARYARVHAAEIKAVRKSKERK